MEVLRSETMGDSGRHGDGTRDDMGRLVVKEGAASRNLSQKMQLRRSISLLETEKKGMDGMEARTHARAEAEGPELKDNEGNSKRERWREGARRAGILECQDREKGKEGMQTECL